jgi:hypothetical protein
MERSLTGGFQPIDGLGITFIILESASVVMTAVGLTCHGGDIFSRSGGRIFAMGFLSLHIWPALTVADMICSGVTVHNNNWSRGFAVVSDDESTVAFSWCPRVECHCDPSFERRRLSLSAFSL